MQNHKHFCKQSSQPQEEDAELTFSEEIDEQFVENCKFLASPETISETDVEHWREQEFLVVAQSLDGDYLGTLEQTFVIPSSLTKRILSNLTSN